LTVDIFPIVKCSAIERKKEKKKKRKKEKKKKRKKEKKKKRKKEKKILL